MRCLVKNKQIKVVEDIKKSKVRLILFAKDKKLPTVSEMEVDYYI